MAGTKAAGNYPRLRENHGVAELFSHGAPSPYGPSQAAFSSWKKTGFPTAEIRQTTTFGMATRRGDTLQDTFRSPEEPVPQQLSAPRRVNPITWDNAPLERVPNRSYPWQQEAPAPAPASRPPSSTLKQSQLSQEQQQQTWAQLMRSGHVSSAQCLVELPPEVLAHNPSEPPPSMRMDVPASYGIGAIGLGTNHAGCGANFPRSQKFTSDFRDPYL